MKILTRYLIRAHIGPFIFALSTLTGMLLINVVARRLQEMAGKGLPASVITEVFLLSVPHTLALTVPMAVLVAVLFAFGQLAAENEVTALKASGVNMARLLVPLLIAASVLTGGMVYFMDRILPETNHRLANLLVDIGRKSPTLELKEQVINEIRTGDLRTRYYLRAADIDPTTNELTDVEIHDLSSVQRFRTIYADSGRMGFNQARTDLFLTLYDGWIHQTAEDNPEQFQRLFFDEQRIRIEGVGNQLERGEQSDYRSDREMTLAMLAADAARERLELDRVRDAARAELETAMDQTLAGPATLDNGELVPTPGVRVPGAPDLATKRTLVRLQSLEQEARHAQQRINEREVEYHKKIAIPVACFVFVLLGAPLAIRFPRGGVGMVIAISLAIFGLYYIGLIGGEELGDRGTVSPFWAMWAPNVIFFIFGLLGLPQLTRASATARGGGWDDLWYSLRSRLAALLRKAGRGAEPATEPA